MRRLASTLASSGNQREANQVGWAAVRVRQSARLSREALADLLGWPVDEIEDFEQGRYSQKRTKFYLKMLILAVAPVLALQTEITEQRPGEVDDLIRAWGDRALPERVEPPE